MHRFVLKLAYEGTAYHGFQKQEGLQTIAGEVESVLEKLFPGECGNFIGASRTDRGVHALGNILSFDTEMPRKAENYERALNSFLPGDIRVLLVKEKSEAFHPRFTEHSKEYRYSVDRARVQNPLTRRLYYHYTYPLDLLKMRDAASRLAGEHDFTSFANPKAQSLLQGGSAVRTVQSFSIEEEGEYLYFTVKGDGFLYHMVRILSGTLLEVGRGKREPEDIEEILQGKDRRLAGPTAPPEGLCLLHLDYGDAL